MLEPAQCPIQVACFHDNPSLHPPAGAGSQVRKVPRAGNTTDKVNTRRWETTKTSCTLSKVWSEKSSIFSQRVKQNRTEHSSAAAHGLHASCSSVMFEVNHKTAAEDWMNTVRETKCQCANVCPVRPEPLVHLHFKA